MDLVFVLILLVLCAVTQWLAWALSRLGEVE